VTATLSALVPAVMATAGSASTVILPGGTSAIVANGWRVAMSARAIEARLT
jgi:hypothetical protein